jgi:hypothetical protein
VAEGSGGDSKALLLPDPQKIKTMSVKVSIQQGFPNALRSSAAELYDAAFGDKLSIAISNPLSRMTVLKEGFNPTFSFVAVSAQ